MTLFLCKSMILLPCKSGFLSCKSAMLLLCKSAMLLVCYSSMLLHGSGSVIWAKKGVKFFILGNCWFNIFHSSLCFNIVLCSDIVIDFNCTFSGFFFSFCCVKSVKNTTKAWNFSRFRSHVFLHNQVSYFFRVFRYAYETLHAKSTYKINLKLLSCLVSCFLHDQVSCFFRFFNCIKSMKLYTQKVQQKHETFVVFGLVLFTQQKDWF
jgi:hypothetical protein